MLTPLETLSALGALMVALYFWYTARPSNLPPGPPRRLFIGNKHQIPKEKPWRWFRDISLKYGPIVYLEIGSTPTIILGNSQAAWDLLEKRGSIYSSRPRFVMGQELLSDNRRGLMAPQGPYWRRWRKVLHGSFMQKASDAYKPIQSMENKKLMFDLLSTPNNFRKHIERYATSTILTVTYGQRVPEVDDLDSYDIVIDNRHSVEYLVSVNIPGKFMAESFPILTKLPAWLAPWKKSALDRREKDIKLYTGLVEGVRKKMEAGTAPVSFTKQLLENQAESGMTDIDIAYAASSPFGAGIETSSGTILSFILACTEFGPSFIPKAQEELDRVVGPDRLPTFDDYEDLPFIRAIVNESLRWRPVAVLGGTPHAVIQDDEYMGYHIPKGSTIIAPLWTIHLNPDDFPDPHTFDPERFMSKREYPGPWGHSAFGWGRRVCVGWPLAANSVFINIARILWGFNISKAKDENGKDIPVDTFAYSSGFNSLPLPFKCDITPRQDRQQVIEREWRDAQEEVDLYS